MDKNQPSNLVEWLYAMDNPFYYLLGGSPLVLAVVTAFAMLATALVAVARQNVVLARILLLSIVGPIIAIIDYQTDRGMLLLPPIVGIVGIFMMVFALAAAADHITGQAAKTTASVLGFLTLASAVAVLFTRQLFDYFGPAPELLMANVWTWHLLLMMTSLLVVAWVLVGVQTFVRKTNRFITERREAKTIVWTPDSGNVPGRGNTALRNTGPVAPLRP